MSRLTIHSYFSALLRTSLSLTALSALTANASAASGVLSAIRITAERTVLRADGVSTTVITAQVYDDHGSFAPDGTRVRFATTAGRFDADVVATQNGVARATLTSADQPGTALVTALLDTPGQAVPSNITITFSRDADASETGSAWVRIDGDYTAYATDFANVKVIQANGSKGKARISYRGLTIQADLLQIDLNLNIVTATGNVKISKEDAAREYHDLRFDLLAGTGIGQRLEDGQLKTYNISGSKLGETAPPANAPPMDPTMWTPQDLSNANFTIVARSIALEPNTVLQFRNATIYINGDKLISFKYHVMALGQTSLFADPLVGYGPSGLTVDLPYLYDVQPNTVGTLHLRDGAQVGSSVYSVRPGWSLDAIQTYNGPKSIEGTAEVDGIGRGDWSAQLRHGQRLDNQTTGSVFLQAPNINDLFLTTQATRSYKTFEVSVLGSGSRTGAVVDPTTGVRGNVSGDSRGQITAQTFGRPVFGTKNLQYVLETGVSRQGFYGGNTAVSQGIVDTQQLSSRFYTPPLPIAPLTTLTQSLTVAQNWVEGSAATASGVSASGISTLGTTTLSRSFGSLGSGNINYNYTQTPQILTSGIATASSSEEAHHRIGIGGIIARSHIWSLTVNGSRGLDVDEATAFSVLSFGLGGPTRGSITWNDTRANGIDYVDLEYRLTRHIYGRDFSFYYSSTSRRIQFDLTSIAF